MSCPCRVDRWLPFQMMIFGILNACQFWMKGRGSFLAFRVLIAFFQGGFIPDAILYMSYFYTKNELPVRLAIFWCVNSSTSLLNGFLAVGILEMRGLGGKAGWQVGPENALLDGKADFKACSSSTSSSSASFPSSSE